MSACTFIASDSPLPAAGPLRDHPLKINVDTGTIYDGGTDDNFFLHIFRDAQNYTDKKYGVWLEWRYTEGRANQLVNYIKEALCDTDCVELWHVWLTDYYDFEDRPVIRGRTIPIEALTADTIKEIDDAQIWNTPDKAYPNRPSFYRLTIVR